MYTLSVFSRCVVRIISYQFILLNFQLNEYHLNFVRQDYRPKFPLLIDPDGVACQRIQELEADNKLVTIDVSSR